MSSSTVVIWLFGRAPESASFVAVGDGEGKGGLRQFRRDATDLFERA
jgi:hypothetical protein